ncbi:hypothetical protein [Shewanella nanhaiensis]|uniref:Uncharacterized protein n=1 Tax=Shewanella nanhaiensis TaxID=2864872 RepID=A0ABS7E3L6_9GAMM|nr:hypothetical protein [Shewanella nanhaiensis]MBW8184269.1 hypothetical protein [Shewanella nanhaiensis]
MKVITIKFFAAITLCFVSNFAQAQFWSSNTKITKVYPYTDGLIFFTEYRNSDVSTCDGGTRFSIDKSHPNYEVMVSTLLAAFMSDKTMTMNVSSTTRACAPHINRFLVTK